jgi:transposase-like protein
METKKNLTLRGLVSTIADETKARELLESMRWPSGATCPRCGSTDVSKITPQKESVNPARDGLYRCKDCRKAKLKDQFTVTVGTIFEDSHIKLSTWLQAISLMCSSKKGISAHQVHRSLGITYKSAWFMMHRIRFAMQQTPFRRLKGIIEADETYVGGKGRRIGRLTGFENKMPVVSLVQRNGQVRSFHIPSVSAATLKQTLLENVHPSSHLMTDELPA